MLKRRRLGKRIIYLAEYSALMTVRAVLVLLPERFAYRFSRLLANIAFHVLRIRRDVTIDNLQRAYGDTLDRKKIARIARISYGNIGMTFVEILLIARLKDRIPDLVDISDIDVLRSEYKKGRGVILVSAHFGSWELNGASLGLAGIPVTVVGKRQANPYVDNYITAYRTDMGMSMLSHGVSIRYLIKALREGQIVGLISDQDAGRRGVFVDFFGSKASTPGGAAQLALKYGAPVVVVMTKRTKPGFYKTIFRKVEVFPGDTVEELTQRYTSIMEDIIRENPEQYFWMHRRWKTRPHDRNGNSRLRTSMAVETEE